MSQAQLHVKHQINSGNKIISANIRGDDNSMIGKWWQSLQERERRLMSIGGVVVIILLVYAWIFNPLSNGIDQLQENIQSQQSLIIWLQHARQQIQQLRKAGWDERRVLNQPVLVIALRKR